MKVFMPVTTLVEQEIPDVSAQQAALLIAGGVTLAACAELMSSDFATCWQWELRLYPRIQIKNKAGYAAWNLAAKLSIPKSETDLTDCLVEGSDNSSESLDALEAWLEHQRNLYPALVFEEVESANITFDLQ